VSLLDHPPVATPAASRHPGLSSTRRLESMPGNAVFAPS